MTVEAAPVIGEQLEAPRHDEQSPTGYIEIAGDIAGFTWRAIRQMGFAVRHYSPEILRQAGILVTGSLPVILMITFFSGGTCGLEMTVIGRQFGAATLSPGAVVLCNVREIAPFVFGYVLAAKVGCGIVAELGAMRVHEEVDALDVTGVRSVAFLVSARMLAAAIALPGAYILSQVVSTWAAYLVSEVRFADISPGTWVHVFFSFLDGKDVVRVFIKGMSMCAFVMAVSLYFGYRCRGGPVEVGTATAKSMAVNIVGVTIINVSLSLAFWGVGAPFPIA
jgi:phospholipid/cholesterol/gamma-HCH transport system permease protein